MTLHWMLYLLAISILLSFSGLLLERLVRPRFWPVRAVWLLVMVCTVALPATADLASHRHAMPALGVVPAASPGGLPTVISPSQGWIRLERAYRVDETATLAHWATVGWLTISLLTLGWIAVSMGIIARRRHRWTPGTLAGQDVLWSQHFGPAVVGVVNPRIVLPKWVRSLPGTRLHLILQHERSHIRAHDPLLLALGMAVVVLAPWNPLLWWQLRRLRLSIEVDCDRRVLRAGAPTDEYASTLLACSVRRQSLLGVTAAMSEPTTSLERRIALMNEPKPVRMSRMAALAAVGAALMLVAATQVPSPPAPVLTVSDLQSYVGSYDFSGSSVLKIDRSGDHLTAAGGRGAGQALVADGTDRFRYGDEGAALKFERDGQRHVMGVTLLQNGAATLARRLDSEGLAARQKAVALRIANHQPQAGSEGALRRLIEGLQAGAPDYSMLSDQMAGGTRVMLPQFKAALSALGTIRSVDFRGINDDGWDEFAVRHEHGVSSWTLSIDAGGIVVGAMWHEGA